MLLDYVSISHAALPRVSCKLGQRCLRDVIGTQLEKCCDFYFFKHTSHLHNNFALFFCSQGAAVLTVARMRAENPVAVAANQTSGATGHQVSAQWLPLVNEASAAL